MTSETILYLILGGLAGGFINGFAGTGTALFALGFFLTVLEPKSAVAIVALMSALIGLQGLFVVRREIFANTARLMRFIVPGLIGVPIGISLLRYVDAGTLRLVVAGFLIFYGGYFGFRRALPRFDRRTPKTDATVGLAGGILGGLASLSGAPPAIWLSMRPWPKHETRAVLQPFNVVILSTTVAMLAWNGAFDAATWAAFAVALPAGLLAVQLGIFAFRRVSDDQFRRTLIILCLALGLGILARDLGLF
ncbi:sulfite exporter TauE/SafE family protein [Aestuariicoccus sp. MJ-SS9]|uniref:sulfite exporter TauE/SafE family protein n=1 Tax=Aestuariicoccus sp. MJ-SS9 TaxID=3079855 RepID=UPI00290A4306|nr:sulfite exporter TauE/SafE family protein [Aestuariicoccus sp. MJ-SS9]MDU8913164.1 sulfite exporter TauE/SafE family protein [Aestuariicoccus sp. MJ-SS9]